MKLIEICSNESYVNLNNIDTLRSLYYFWYILFNRTISVDIPDKSCIYIFKLIRKVVK